MRHTINVALRCKAATALNSWAPCQREGILAHYRCCFSNKCAFYSLCKLPCYEREYELDQGGTLVYASQRLQLYTLRQGSTLPSHETATSSRFRKQHRPVYFHFGSPASHKCASHAPVTVRALVLPKRSKVYVWCKPQEVGHSSYHVHVYIYLELWLLFRHGTAPDSNPCFTWKANVVQLQHWATTWRLLGSSYSKCFPQMQVAEGKLHLPVELKQHHQQPATSFTWSVRGRWNEDTLQCAACSWSRVSRAAWSGSSKKDQVGIRLHK